MLMLVLWEHHRREHLLNLRVGDAGAAGAAAKGDGASNRTELSWLQRVVAAQAAAADANARRIARTHTRPY
jgi:hypothetical protein